MMEVCVLNDLALTANAVVADGDLPLCVQLSSQLDGVFARPSGVSAEIARCVRTVDAATFDPATADPGVYYFLTGEVIG